MRILICFLALCATAWTQFDITGASVTNGLIQLDWVGGNAPWTVESRPDGGTNWTVVTTATTPSASLPATQAFQHFRVLAGPAVTPSARYRVTFNATWTAATHPGNYPGPNAHFTDFEGVTHNTNISFWAVGDLATPGMEIVAELGVTATWLTEIDAALEAGTGDQAFSLIQPGSPSFIDSPGTITAEFDVNASHPLVTFASMLAPSPDWFVGVSGYDLMAGGDWVDDVSFRATVYDAGTETGSTFSLSNPAEDPHQPISVETTIDALAPFGSFRFERIDQ